MIRPAVFITWPVHADYPLFRFNLHKNRQYFQDIFIAFTEHNIGQDYKRLIIQDLPFVKFVTPLQIKSDWRDDALTTMLSRATDATHYLFLEQDFLVKSYRFYENILNTDNDFVYFKEGDRIHPAFCLIKREIVDKTSRDFMAYPDEGMDHFGKFFKEITELIKGKEIREFGFKNKDDFYHMNSLTQNYHCFNLGQPLYKEKEFLSYNLNSMLVPHQIPQFYLKQLEISEKYGIKDKETFLTSFFPEE